MSPQEPAEVGGLVPERTADPAEAAALVARNGAAILTGRATDEDGARQVARDVLGERLVVLADPAAVREGGEKDRSEIGAGDLMPLHVDGFAYGDRHLDALFLLCVSRGTGGGASFLADGYAVLDHLATADPDCTPSCTTCPSISPSPTCSRPAARSSSPEPPVGGPCAGSRS